MAQRLSFLRRLPWRYILPALIIVSGLWLFAAFASKELYPVPLTGQTPVYLGLSVVEQDFSNVLKDISDNEKKTNDWLTSFLLQSPRPAALVYLDYIRIPKNPSLPEEICFKSITLSRSQTVPTEITPGIIPDGLTITTDKYLYKFPDERCMAQDQKYIIPHIFLGALPVNASVPVLNVRGFRAADYFPFDQQSISLDIVVESDDLIFSPSIEVVVAQKGWEGSFYFDHHKPVLYLGRSIYYQVGLVFFFIVMAATIPFLGRTVMHLEDKSGFFEVVFGLILGLWGTHQILIPNYIQVSLPIDLVIYILYALLLLQTWMILLTPRTNLPHQQERPREDLGGPLA